MHRPCLSEEVEAAKGEGTYYYVVPPFQVVVEDGLKTRPEQHVYPVEEAVKHRDPSSLHHHGERVRDLDHEEKPDAIAARGEVGFEILDAQGQRPRENLVKSVVRLPLCQSTSKKLTGYLSFAVTLHERANNVHESTVEI